MTATNHALAGGFIGAVLPLTLAIPVAFVSHFILDAMPHYGIPIKQRNKSPTYHLILLCDFLVATLLLIATVLLHKWNMAIAGFVAFSPDAYWVGYYFRNGKTLQMKPKNRLMRFHQNIQKFERPWGLTVEFFGLVVLISLYVNKVQ